MDRLYAENKEEMGGRRLAVCIRIMGCFAGISDVVLVAKGDRRLARGRGSVRTEYEYHVPLYFSSLKFLVWVPSDYRFLFDTFVSSCE